MVDTSDFKRQRSDDMLDFNAEITGQELGRIKRFLSEAAQEELRIRQGKSPRKDRFSLLDMLLLTDPLYQRLYLALDEKITSIEERIAEKLNEIDRNLDVLENARQVIQDNAYILPSGRRVYRCADGSACYEDGSAVEETIADTIIWQPHHATWEEYIGVSSSIGSLKEQRREITDYRDNKVRPIKTRMRNHEEQMDHDALEEAVDDLDRTMPKALQEDTIEKQHMSQDASALPLSATFQLSTRRTELPANEALIMDIPDFGQPETLKPRAGIKAF